MDRHTLIGLGTYLLPVGFVLFGAFVLTSALRTTGRLRRFRRRALRAEGVVTGNDVDSPSMTAAAPNARSYFPRFRFRTHTGGEVEATSAFGSTMSWAEPGSRIGVLYDPDDPTLATADTYVGRGDLRSWLLPLAGAIIILIGLAVGIPVYAGLLLNP